MNRKIVEQIKFVIANCPFSDKVKVYTLERQSDGFWELSIKGSSTHLKHVETVALAIGNMNGEGLFTRRLSQPGENSWLELS